MDIQGWFPLGLIGLISLQSKEPFRVYWSRLQYHDSKTLTLQPSIFFMDQLPHPYMTTGKIVALNTWTIVSKVKSLLFNTPSGLDIAFLPRRKCLLISWLQSPSSRTLEPKKIKSITASTFFPLLFPWNNGSRYHDLSFLNVEFSASFFTLLFHLHQEALYFLLIFY